MGLFHLRFAQCRGHVPWETNRFATPISSSTALRSPSPSHTASSSLSLSQTSSPDSVCSTVNFVQPASAVSVDRIHPKQDLPLPLPWRCRLIFVIFLHHARHPFRSVNALCPDFTYLTKKTLCKVSLCPFLSTAVTLHSWLMYT